MDNYSYITTKKQEKATVVKKSFLNLKLIKFLHFDLVFVSEIAVVPVDNNLNNMDFVEFENVDLKHYSGM